MNDCEIIALHYAKKCEDIEADSEQLKKRIKGLRSSIHRIAEDILLTGSYSDDVEFCEAIIEEIGKLRNRINLLEAVYDHPNHDDPKRRYLYEIRKAIKLLREFSGREGGGEYALGVAMQLDQFYKRARVALKGE